MIAKLEFQIFESCGCIEHKSCDNTIFSDEVRSKFKDGKSDISISDIPHSSVFDLTNPFLDKFITSIKEDFEKKLLDYQEQMPFNSRKEISVRVEFNTAISEL